MRAAFPTNNEETIAKHIGLCKKIVIYENEKKVEVIENPILKMVKEENLPMAKAGERHFGTGRILSKFLSEKSVDMFVVAQFYSQGLKQNLEYLGIVPYETQEKDIEAAAVKAKAEVMNLLRQTIRPEFLNRVDEIIMFDVFNR